MGFKQGKQNPYNVLKQELDKVKKQLEEERTVKPMLRIFAERLGQALLVQLASVPYAKWPQFAKNTFAWVANDAPTAAYLYKDRLPKE